MRNKIAYFAKTSSCKVIFWAKLNAKINSALISPIIFTLLQLVFSKEAILFLIYLLADKAIWYCFWHIFAIFSSSSTSWIKEITLEFLLIHGNTDCKDATELVSSKNDINHSIPLKCMLYLDSDRCTGP